jgi:hypothetical protein
LAAVATMGVFSSSAWQILPRSQFLEEVRNAPMPPGLRIRQIHATGDVLCPLPPPLAGIDRLRDYIVLPGGHASLVVAPIFYKKVHEFLQEQEEPTVIVP